MRKLILFLGLTILVFNGLYAQWYKTSMPNGGIVQCIVTQGDTLLAGTYLNGGMYFSNNSGETWEKRTFESDFPIVQDIIIKDNTIFAATAFDGVIVSIDYGINWVKSNTGFPSTIINTLEIGNGKIYAGLNEGLYESLDNGLNWERTDTALEKYPITSIAVKGDDIFLGTWMNGLFLSKDKGVSWESVNSGITVPYIRDILIKDDKLFVGTASGGVFESIDGGNNWISKNNGLSNYFINKLALNGDNFYAGTWDGLYLSTDFGDNWVRIINGLTDVEIRSVCADENAVYAGTNGLGIFKSEDQGSNWRAINYGMKGLEVNGLVTLGNDIFAGTDQGGVFKANLDNLDWVSINNGLPVKYIESIAILGNKIIVGNDGIYMSVDTGNNWIESSNGLTDHQINSMITANGNVIIGTPGGVYISEDTTKNWANVSNGLTSQYILSIAHSNDRLYAGTASSGIFMSVDTAKNWIDINNELLSTITVSAILPVDTCIYAGTRGYGVILSKDYGDSWTIISNGLKMGELSINSLAQVGDTIIAGTEKGMFKLDNDNLTWYPCIIDSKNTTDKSEVDTTAISTIYYDNQYVYAGTRNNEVWINGLFIPNLSLSGEVITIGAEENSIGSFSIQSNVNWTITEIPTWLSANIESGNGNATITLTAQENTSSESRIVRLNINSEELDVKNITVTQQGMITGISDLKNDNILIYPNPTTGIIYFKNIDNISGISITDIRGQYLVENMHIEEYDLSNLNNGIYFIKIHSNNETIVEKILKY